MPFSDDEIEVERTSLCRVAIQIVKVEFISLTLGNGNIFATSLPTVTQYLHHVPAVEPPASELPVTVGLRIESLLDPIQELLPAAAVGIVPVRLAAVGASDRLGVGAVRSNLGADEDFRPQLSLVAAVAKL